MSDENREELLELFTTLFFETADKETITGTIVASRDECKQMMKRVWNAAIDKCAETAELDADYLPSRDDIQYFVKRESITKNKIV